MRINFTCVINSVFLVWLNILLVHLIKKKLFHVNGMQFSLEVSVNTNEKLLTFHMLIWKKPTELFYFSFFCAIYDNNSFGTPRQCKWILNDDRLHYIILLLHNIEALHVITLIIHIVIFDEIFLGYFNFFILSVFCGAETMNFSWMTFLPKMKVH